MTSAVVFVYIYCNTKTDFFQYKIRILSNADCCLIDKRLL